MRRGTGHDSPARPSGMMTDMSDVNGTKKLLRTRDGRLVAGVCSGIGDYLGMDANVIRLVFALITVFTAGLGILLYLVAWVVLPEEGEVGSIAEKMIKKNS
jgi:phage shock protein C